MRRIDRSWENVIFNLLFALVFSFLCFLPSDGEVVYNIDNRVMRWPYYFLGFFIFGALAVHDKKLTRKLDEGITLIQTTAVLYWIFDSAVFSGQNIFLQSVAVFGILFSAFSFFHAFSYTKLTSRHRLILSVGSSIIMIFFASDYTYNIYMTGEMEDSLNFGQGLYNVVQYFLLGVSTVYIVHNLFMITDFIPSKASISNYSKELTEIKEKHVNRYSKKQVKIPVSLLFLGLSALVFFLNNYFQLVPSHTAIWILFVSFPAIAFVQGKFGGSE